MLLSLDISTSCIGIALFNEKGGLMELSYVSFNSKQTIFEKFAKFTKSIEHILKMDIKRIAIEKPLEKFKGKFSSAHTIAILNFFNGMISSFVFNHFKVEPNYYNVNNARSTVFEGFKKADNSEQTKHDVWERVMQMEPQINWKYSKTTMKLMTENYDMVDAYVVGVCDMIILDKQKKILDTKEK